MAKSGKMKLAGILFFVSLLIAQLGAIPLGSGVVVYMHDILLVFLLLLSLPRILRKTKRIHPKLIKPILVFIYVSILSLLINAWRFPLPELLSSSLYLVRWILYASMYLIILASSDVYIWINGLYVTGVGFAILGLMQFVMYPYLRNLSYLGWDPHYYRVFSTLFDPNFTGIILIFTLLLGFELWKKKKKNYFLIAGQAAAFIALLLTYSRSGYLAISAALVVWAMMRKKWKILLAIAALVVFVIVMPRAPGNTLKLTRMDSTRARVGNWQASIQLISKAPVFGYGFNTLRFVQGDTFHETGIISKSASGLDSSLLFVLATCGIIGFAAYANLLISMIRLGRNKTFYIASITALIVHSLFVNSMFYAWVMLFIWIMTASVEKLNQTTGDM